MLYLNNQELAASHHVSVRTVRNWIEAAKAGKLDLSLHTKGERAYIANTSKNTSVIEELVAKGKKYRPHRSQKTVMPQSKFYELYTQEQIYDIVANLEINHETPYQYYYFGEGASNWDGYASRLAEEDDTNMLKAAVQLLEDNEAYLNKLLKQYKQVNIIDIGVGNAMPVRKLLERFIKEGRLGRYIGLDLSPTMLKIAENNINKWFGDRVKFEGYQLDIEHDRFGNLLAEEYIKTNSNDTSNIILFFGGTLANFKRPDAILQVIHDSMGVNDFYIQQQKLDTQSSRRYFDFNPAVPSMSLLAPIDRFLFDLLNIDESLYDVEMGYDPVLGERYIRAVLKVALSIKFVFKKGERIIAFNKGDKILLWRYRQSDFLEIVANLNDNDLYPLQVSQTDDQEYLLAISRIKRD